MFGGGEVVLHWSYPGFSYSRCVEPYILGSGPLICAHGILCLSNLSNREHHISIISSVFSSLLPSPPNLTLTMASHFDEKVSTDPEISLPEDHAIGSVSPAKPWDPTDSPEDDQTPLTPELGAKITRKLDIHIMPWLFVLWLLAFIDRSNIGNARIAGLSEDLNLTSNKFNIALAVFYVPYIIYDIPSNLILKKFRAGYYLPLLLITWGIVSLCTGFVTSYTGLLVARFFLGWAEGGLYGGLIIYLAMFYRRHQLLYRIALFYCAAPLSGAFGGLLATGLAQIKTDKYEGWVRYVAPHLIFRIRADV